MRFSKIDVYIINVNDAPLKFKLFLLFEKFSIFGPANLNLIYVELNVIYYFSRYRKKNENSRDCSKVTKKGENIFFYVVGSSYAKSAFETIRRLRRASRMQQVQRVWVCI